MPAGSASTTTAFPYSLKIEVDKAPRPKDEGLEEHRYLMATITDRSQLRQRERRLAGWGIFILVIAIGGSALLWAQGAALPAAASAAAPTAADPNAVRLMVGRSAVVDVGTAIARVSLTRPDICLLYTSDAADE